MQSGYKLDENEQIVFRVNRHWIDLAPMAVSAGGLILVAVALGYGFSHFGYLAPFIPGTAITIIMLVLLGLAVVVALTGAWVYRQNYLLLTNLHLIQVVQQGLFSREVSQLSLARVQDVTGRRSGLLATIMNFGEVIVQTAGERDEFVFNNAPNPQQLADRFLAAHEEFIKANPDREM